MATRSLNVVISGDARQLGAATKKAGDHIKDVEKRGAQMGKVLAVGFATAGAAAAGALVVGLKKSVDAAVEAEKSQARLEAQMRAMGRSYQSHAKEIDAVIQKHSKLAGIDDEDLQDAFTNIARATGSVNTAMKDMALVTDLARGKNMDVAKAGDLLAKVHNGNVGALKRLGIAIEPVTKAQDKLKESGKQATDEQIRSAKAQDKQATAQKAIAELQQRFAGQAKAYGETAAGAQDRFRVAIENLQEKIGAHLLPVLARVAGAVATFIGQIESGRGAGGRFAEIVGRIAGVIRDVVGRVVDFGMKLRDAFSGGDRDATSSVSKIVESFKRLYTDVSRFVGDLVSRLKSAWAGMSGDLEDIGRAWLKFQGWISGAVSFIARKVLPGLGQAFGGVATTIRGFVRIIAGIVSGDWKKALEGLKTVLRGQLETLKGVARAAWDLLGPALVSLGKLLVRKLVEGLKGLPGAIKDGIVGAVNWAKDNVPGLVAGALKGLGSALWGGIKKGFSGGLFGDGLGKAMGDGVGNMFPAFGGGLMGARASMAPVAGAASRFGLNVTSGLRPGAITSSGNQSYHSSGEALDVAGTPAGMKGFFNFMKNTMGSGLAELIYTPGGAGIRNGRSHTYSGKVAADHFDHVHVAVDTGAPGVGDGIGQIRNLWTRAGGRASVANLAAAIAMAESGGDPNVSNRNTDGSIDRGLWQINSVHGRMSTFDRMGNARAAVSISGNGRNWNPWTVYRSGAYKKFLSGKAGGKGSSKSREAPRGERSEYDPESMYAVGPAAGQIGQITGEQGGILYDSNGQPLLGLAPPPPGKGAGSGPPKGLPAGYEPTEAPSDMDWLDLALAKAEATPGAEDDVAALRAIKAAKETQLAGTSDPRVQAGLIREITTLTGSIEQLQGTINEQNEIERRRDELNEQIATNQLRIIALAEQGPQIVAAVVAAVSGGIGGQLGLGFQTPGYAGGVARY